MSIVSNMGFDFYVNRLESREEKAGVFNTINQAFVPNFADLNGRLTFADQHSRTHSWEAVRWQDVAGDATTQVFSSFANDRADNVATALVSNRMIAGQTQDFTAEALLAFAEASVGAVQGNFANSKVVLTLLETGSPDAMA